MNTVEDVIKLLKSTGDINERTEIIQNWIKNQPDDKIRSRYHLNSTIPHSIFNVTSRIFGGDNIQNINWFLIHKTRDFGMWERERKKIS